MFSVVCKNKGTKTTAVIEFVYVIGYKNKPDGPIKVGFTRNLKLRLAGYTSHSPDPMQYFHVLPVEAGWAKEIESRALSILYEHHRYNEWFDCDPDTAYKAIEQAALMIPEAKSKWVHRMLFPGFEKVLRFPESIYPKDENLS